MAYIAKKHTSQLEQIKQCVEQSYVYFRANYERYHQFMRFVYKSTLTEDDIAVLATLGRPQIEFNMMEAYISRLRGEFSRMEPGFIVRAQDGFDKDVNPKLLEVLEAHFRSILIDSDNDGFSYDVYTDLLVGGFSVVEVYTDYLSEMSMDQKICTSRVFDPTLCGFDPLARKSHKGDGNYCFQLFPKECEEVEKEYGSNAVKGLKYARSFAGFNWSYRAAKKDIVLMCQFDKKIYKKEKITKLSNGRVVSVKNYEELRDMWDQSGFIEQPPIPIGKTRETIIEQIERHTFSGAELVDVQKTNFKMLPLIFFDGNSAVLRDNNDATAEQMTRPYIYNVKDAQRLKNYAGQSLANELENTIEHKFIASVESIPEDYLDGYINVQKPASLLYNAFYDGNPEIQLAPPREVMRTPIPPQISETFQMSDNLIQGILGSYDAALGIQNNELSGVAIMQGAMHSNAAAMPYTVGFMKGLNRVCQIILDLIPKYYVTPRSIPIVKPDGKRSYEVINKTGNPFMSYDSSSLEVKVEAGVNFAVQKQISLETIIQLMQTSESFAAFINTKGLGILLDNIEIRGIEGLRQAASQFMEETQQKQQQAEQMAQQQAQQQIDPKQVMAMQAQAEMAKVQQKEKAVETQAQVDLIKISTDDAVKNKDADIEFLKVMAQIQNSDVDAAVKQEKVDAENARTAVEMAVNVSAHHHDIAHKDREHELKKKEIASRAKKKAE